MNPFIEREREEERKRVRSFCASRGADGGILIVCGPRGCGKTRLVGEALSEACEQTWWRLLFGDSHRRRQPCEARPPRDIPRLLFKVEVDPFFPHPCRRKGDKPEPEPMDPNGMAFQLLRNLVFALTSLLDPRLSQRRFGRTLRGRLGFWRYWFSPTGLHWPFPAHPDSCWKKPLLAVFVLLCMVLALVVLALLSPAWEGARWIVFLAPVLITVSAWLFLRWRDWSALARFSSQLYDLVHAQDIDKSEQFSQSAGVQLSQRWNLPAIALVLLGVVSIGVGAFSWLAHGGTELKGGPGSLVTLLLGTGLLVWSRQLGWKESNTARFGQQNPVWMITQLRRYLFLLHRVGIEPVLVFDELDKLEDDVFASRRRPSPAQAVAAADARPAEHTSGQLDSFLDVIQRLRQMLAGDFVTILVGGWDLVRAYEQALDGSFPLPLGSIVQEAIYLGPVSPLTVKEWWDQHPEKHCESDSEGQAEEAIYLGPVSPAAVEKWWDKHSEKLCESDSEGQAESDSQAEAPVAWVFSKGLYARLQGYRRNWTASEEHREAIQSMAEVAGEYWETDAIIRWISNGDAKPWMRHLTRHRVLTLLRVGMAEQAFDYAFDEGSLDGEEAMWDPDEIEKRIKSSDPEDRIAVGRLILARCIKEKKEKEKEKEKEKSRKTPGETPPGLADS